MPCHRRRIGTLMVLGALALGGVVAPRLALGQATDSLSREEAERLFLKSCDAYEQKRYDEAVASFERLARAGYDGGPVWYNLANAYFRHGDLGPSIWAYLKSAELLRRSEDLRANLGLARNQTKDALPPRLATPLASTLFFWHYNFNLRERLWLLAVVNALFWLAFVVRLYRRDELLTIVRVVLCVALIGVGTSVAMDLFWPKAWGVVVGDQVAVMSASDRQSVTLFKLHAGAEFEVDGQADSWVQMRLSDGKRGWLPRGQVLLNSDQPGRAAHGVPLLTVVPSGR